MTRNVPKVISSITTVEEDQPSGRFIWEAVFSIGDPYRRLMRIGKCR